MFRLSRMQSTKDKIKQATYELLASKGYSLISMRDIAQRAGTVVGQLTYHYRTKECLMENGTWILNFLNKLKEIDYKQTLQHAKETVINIYQKWLLGDGNKTEEEEKITESIEIEMDDKKED